MSDRTDLAPAFPHWMRASDPLLQREDSNALFQAFRTRRGGSRRRMWGRLVAGLACECSLAAAAILLWRGWEDAGYGALALAAATFALRAKLVGAEGSARRAPNSLGKVFGIHPDGTRRPPAVQMATDLLMAGLRTRDLVETLYLERREYTLVMARQRFAAAAMMLAAGTLAMRSLWSPQPVTILPLLAVYAFGWTAFRMMMTEGGYWACQHLATTFPLQPYERTTGGRMVEVGTNVALALLETLHGLLVLGSATTVAATVLMIPMAFHIPSRWTIPYTFVLCLVTALHHGYLMHTAKYRQSSEAWLELLSARIESGLYLYIQRYILGDD